MEKSCNGACLYGACPYSYCIKYKQGRAEAIKLRSGANILEDFELKEIRSCKSGYGIAADIGTTTIAVYLYDMGQSKLLSVKTAINPQTACGADVLSRISYCERFQEGTKDLQKMLIEALDALIENACVSARINSRGVEEAVISGNTVMMHLLAGLSPVSMGTHPFVPECTFDRCYTSEELGFKNKSFKIYIPKCISAFIGADITSAILASGITDEKQDSLLMDLGTNGELVLKAGEGLYVTSAPAGPAFEGVSLERGMACVNGAVYEVFPFDGRLKYKVIGGGTAAGLCGSGLLDCVAFFLTAKAIDRTGLITDPSGLKEEISRYIKKDGENYRIELSERAYITQKDIRQLQNAKAAVAAGVMCLMRKAQVKIENIGSIYLAGGFGNALKPETAYSVGLIDKSFPGKIKSIGNGSAAGAVMMLLDDKYRLIAKNIADTAKNVQIGGDQYFQEEFIKNMDF